ncbi:hypothetical protein BHM03_00052633, partial [Ensete ventricosum]
LCGLLHRVLRQKPKTSAAFDNFAECHRRDDEEKRRRRHHPLPGNISQATTRLRKKHRRRKKKENREKKRENEPKREFLHTLSRSSSGTPSLNDPDLGEELDAQG